MSDLLNNNILGSIKKQREEIIKIWEKSGFLDGLKGHVKDDIAKLFECCKSSKIPKD